MEFLEGAWDQPDEGIWEVRGPRRHFTHSKVLAWVAFDRAVQAVERFARPGPGRPVAAGARGDPRGGLPRGVQRRAELVHAGVRVGRARCVDAADPDSRLPPGRRPARHRHDRCDRARPDARRLRRAVQAEGAKRRRRSPRRRRRVPAVLVLARRRAADAGPRRRRARALRDSSSASRTTSACSRRSTTRPRSGCSATSRRRSRTSASSTRRTTSRTTTGPMHQRSRRGAESFSGGRSDGRAGAPRVTSASLAALRASGPSETSSDDEQVDVAAVPLELAAREDQRLAAHDRPVLLVDLRRHDQVRPGRARPRAA